MIPNVSTSVSVLKDMMLLQEEKSGVEGQTQESGACRLALEPCPGPNTWSSSSSPHSPALPPLTMVHSGALFCPGGPELTPCHSQSHTSLGSNCPAARSLPWDPGLLGIRGQNSPHTKSRLPGDCSGPAADGASAHHSMLHPGHTGPPQRPAPHTPWSATSFTWAPPCSLNAPLPFPSLLIPFSLQTSLPQSTAHTRPLRAPGALQSGPRQPELSDLTGLVLCRGHFPSAVPVPAAQTSSGSWLEMQSPRPLP